MTNQKFKLYYKVDPDRSFRIRWLLRELDLPFEEQQLDAEKGEHKSPEFLALNPQGKVPVLVTPQGRPLLESGAIVLFLGDAFPEKGLAPSVDAPERADYLKWVFFACTTVEQAWLRLRMARAGEKAELITESEAVARGAVEAAGAGLETGPFLFGEKFTAADCALGYGLTLLSRCPYAVEDVPSVRRYLETVSERWESRGLSLALKRPES